MTYNICNDIYCVNVSQNQRSHGAEVELFIPVKIYFRHLVAVSLVQ